MNGTNSPAGPAPLPDNKDSTNKPDTKESQFPVAGSGIPEPSRNRPTPPPPPVGKAGSGSPAGPPPPPKPQIDIRTMESDEKSLKSSGGLGTKPKTFNPNNLSNESVFDPKKAGAEVKLPNNKKRIIAIVVGIIVVLLIAGAVAYFFVFPLFSQNEPEVTVSEPADTGDSVVNDTGSALVHESFFFESADATREIDLESVETDLLSFSFLSERGAEFDNGTIEEISFTSNGNSVGSDEMLSALIPNANKSFFADDVTGFVYYDKNGLWPGYVFRLEGGADSDLAAEDVKVALEEKTNIRSFYATDPGSPAAGGFLDGPVGNVNARYLSFDDKGASFNYGWVGEYLLLSTSFSGFQSAMNLLPPS